MAEARRGWGRVWPILLASGIGLVASIATWGLEVEANPHLPVGPLLVDLALAPIALVAAILRRRMPLAMALVVAAFAGFSPLSAGFVALMLVSISTRRRAVEISLTAAMVLLSTVTAELTTWFRGSAPASNEPLEWALLVVLGICVCAVPILIGLNVGSRRALIDSLRSQADAARNERDARVEGARVAERERIARELHDELGHRLSLIALHAGALEFREDVPAQRARETAGVIRDSAQNALADLRGTLGMLRGDLDDVEPSPDVGDRIDALVQSARDAGVDLAVDIDPAVESALPSLPGDTGRHLTRIVQECLTNARRHAPGLPVVLTLAGTPGQRVTVAVRNPVAEPAKLGAVPGYGLIGIRERTRLAGGDMQVISDEGRFEVMAWLPWHR